MLNILSILVGLVAVLFAIPGLIPLFGWINYLTLMIAVVGLVVGMLSSKNTGRNLNIIVLIVAVVRLMLGGGFF
jgi:hypothetical protein